MHLYMITRGQKDKVDQYINDLNAQFFTYQATPHKNQPPMMLQLGVRPIQFWEIAFPKEHLNEVLATINGAEFDINDKRWFVKIASWMLKFRKLIGLKPIPKIPPKTQRRAIRDIDIDKKLIGLKDDQYGKVELI